MLSINTNLSSLIAQSSLKESTNLLNRAVERMTTGYKINGAKDNAANYSISTNMTTKINSYMVAEDNAAMGLDMVTSMASNLELIEDHTRRIRDLTEQASNGTYGEDSLRAIQAEIDARLEEIERIKSSAEYNGVKLLETEQATPAAYAMPRAGGGVTGSFIQEVDQLTEEEAIAEGYTIIKTADQLQAMNDNPSGKYILMNDIDLDGYDWTPVGTSYSISFTGELNGNGFVIKNLTINKPTTSCVGLFGRTQNATIKNLGIENADVTGGSAVSILAGSGISTTITNTYAEGSVSGSGSSTGGLVGSNGGSFFTLDSCYADCVVTGTDYVGGLIGYCSSDAYINNCFSSGSVSGDSGVGGLIGYKANFTIEVNNSYTTATVTGSNEKGTIIGDASFGLTTFNNVYYQDNGLPVAGSGTPNGSFAAKTASELQTMIDNGTLVSAKAPPPPVTPAGNPSSITLQVGINGDSNSQITFASSIALQALSIDCSDSTTARGCLQTLDDYLKVISAKQTELGAVTNRLESVLQEISIQYDNLVSSRSTLRDADIAKESSTYIQQQILQQASSTLLATANQSPSIALQLI